MSTRRRKPSRPIFEEPQETEAPSAPETKEPETLAAEKKSPIYIDVEATASEAEATVSDETPIERDTIPPGINQDLLNDQLDEFKSQIVYKENPLDNLLDDIIDQDVSTQGPESVQDNDSSLLEQLIDEDINQDLEPKISPPVVEAPPEIKPEIKPDLNLFKNKTEDSQWQSMSIENELDSEKIAEEGYSSSAGLEENNDFWDKISKSQTDSDFKLPNEDHTIDTPIDIETDEEKEEAIFDNIVVERPSGTDVEKLADVGIEKPTIGINNIEAEGNEKVKDKEPKGLRKKFTQVKENIQDSFGEDPELQDEENTNIPSESESTETAMPQTEEELVAAIEAIVQSGASEEEMAEELTKIGIDPSQLGLGAGAPAPQAAPQGAGAPALEGPPPYVAVRRASLAGNNSLPLELPPPKEEVDEISHALAAFADLSYGQIGFVRMGIRSNPEFQDVAADWVRHRKAGIEPDSGGNAVSKTIAWFKYFGAYIWYSVNQNEKKGTPPPASPGKRGKDLTPLSANQSSDEEKSSWKAAQEKARDNTHFEVVLRVVTIGDKEDAQELEQIAVEASSGFDSFNSPFQEIVWGGDRPDDSLRGLMGARKAKTPNLIPMVLSTSELAEIAHPPDDLTHPHGVRVSRSHFKQIPLDNALTVEDPYNPVDGLIPIGIANKGSEDQEFLAFNNAQLDQHMLIVGKTGSGKSEWLKWACFGVAKANYPFVIIDPHGALSDDILRTLIVTCPERRDDIVYCDLSNGDWPVALNPLDVNSSEQVDPTVGSIMEMLSSQMNLSLQGAPRATMFARQALTALCYANIVLKDPMTKCTLLDVVKFFTNPDFRHLIVEFCENNSVKETFDYDHGVFENLSDKQQTEMSMPIVRAFARLAESNAFAAVFSSPENKLDFGELVGSRKLLIVRLARHSSQRMLGQFVGSLILPWLLGSMDDWGRKKDPDTGVSTGTGVRIFVDEAPTLFGPDSSVPELLAEARKWDLGLVMAAQFLDQFDPGLIKAALANTASKIALASELNTAQIITKSLAGSNSSIKAGDLADLPNYHYYGNLLMPNPSGGVGSSGAFSAACLPPIEDQMDDEAKQVREEIIVRSRGIVANSIEFIQGNEKNRVNNIMLNLRELYAEKADSDYDAPSALIPDEDDDMDSGFNWANSN